MPDEVRTSRSSRVSRTPLLRRHRLLQMPLYPIGLCDSLEPAPQTDATNRFGPLGKKPLRVLETVTVFRVRFTRHMRADRPHPTGIQRPHDDFPVAR